MTTPSNDHVPDLKPNPSRGDLAPGEAHPAAYEAQCWITQLPAKELYMWQEAFSSCAIEGNRLAEVCSETLHRLITGQPVSDRYVCGLAWHMRYGMEPKGVSVKLVKCERANKHKACKHCLHAMEHNPEPGCAILIYCEAARRKLKCL